jgi:hypothetical protein
VRAVVIIAIAGGGGGSCLYPEGERVPVDAAWYEFDDCACEGPTGRPVKIPRGIWPVGELDTVTIIVDRNKAIVISKAAFAQLKLEQKARPRP